MLESKKGNIFLVTIVVFVAVIIGVTYAVFRFAGQKAVKSPTDSESVTKKDEILQQPTLIEESEKSIEPKDSEAVSEDTPKTGKSLPVNFSETGVILDWDAEKEINTGDWKFLYDKPGALALTVKIKLDEGSLCDMGQGEKICEKNEFVNGTTVMLEGNKVDDEVTVLKMSKFEM